MSQISNAVSEAVKDVPIADLLRITRELYFNVRTGIANGTDTSQESIRACNAARKEIDECVKFGLDR